MLSDNLHYLSDLFSANINSRMFYLPALLKERDWLSAILHFIYVIPLLI